MKKYITILFLFVSLFSFGQPLVNGNEFYNDSIVYHVYGVFGQSKARGTGAIVGLGGTGFVGTRKNAYFFNRPDQRMIQMNTDSPIFHCCPNDAGGTFGVELPLAYYYNKVNNPIIFVKYAISASILYQSVTDLDWNAWSTNEYLQWFMNTCDSFEIYANARNINFVWKGMIYDQGEGDAGALGCSVYYQNQTNLIDTVRTHLGIPLLPFYLTGVNPYEPYKDTICQIKTAVAAAMTNVKFIPVYSAEFNADSTHMSTNGTLMYSRDLWSIIKSVNY